jgi:hypothetical protein
MGSVGPTHLVALLAVAIIGAICGLFASAVVRRNRRRARTFFLLGVFCGFMVGAIMGGRRGVDVLRSITWSVDFRRPLQRKTGSRLLAGIGRLMTGSATG